MSFLRPRGRVFLEIVGLAYGALMILLAVVEWVGHYSWRLAPSSLLMVAGLCFLGAIYLVLDEIRLNTRKE
jgi:hypothetical protein